MSPSLTEFGMITPKPGLAYGIDDTRPQLYSLRQSRYQALAEDNNALAEAAAREGRRLRLLDIGVFKGISKRYLDAWPGAANIDFHGADIDFSYLPEPEKWAALHRGDFLAGYPDIPDNSFDVVICEQVLEHLHELGTPIRTLERLLWPGGTLFVGVPIFPPGLAAFRKYAVPQIDKVNPWAKKNRGHVQGFSQWSFVRELRRYTRLEVQSVRGFRVFSGGPLRPLENRRGWWKWNRWLGRKAPWACVEIQVVATKPLPTPR